jgi:hypothetical protein
MEAGLSLLLTQNFWGAPRHTPTDGKQDPFEGQFRRMNDWLDFDAWSGTSGCGGVKQLGRQRNE